MSKQQEVHCMKVFYGREGKSEKGVSGHCLLPVDYSKFAERIWKAPVRKDDVWLVSYPRTGSTWCQEMIWLIQNNLDFQTARTALQQLRAPLIECSVIMVEYVDSTSSDSCNYPIPRYQKLHMPLDLLPSSMDSFKDQLDYLFRDSVSFVEDLPSPRCIKSHLAVELLPEEIFTVKPKMVYTMRNPKDLCVSYFFHLNLVHKVAVDFDTFCELFLNDALPIGSVFHHYFGFWNRRNDPNVLVLRYEEMKASTPQTVRTIAKFLGKSLTDENVDAVCEFLSFQNMRENKACNLQVLVDNNRGDEFYQKSGKHFIRKGIVGDYKNYMSSEMIERFDRWIEESTRGTDLAF
ncbi:luciferin sulfotransferase-like [Euwallacea similis]|uniref:luciferin sulfotransferase-like n=1 Tax=Euwallacea similis TaxID=1736056 RepID=UPI00344BC240